MKTIWEIIDEKFSNVQERDTARRILDKIQGDYLGGEHTVILGTAFPSNPVIRENAIRTNACVSADFNNTGIIYLGFSNIVSSTNYVLALKAGDFFSFDGYRGALWAIANASNQRLGIGEW